MTAADAGPAQAIPTESTAADDIAAIRVNRLTIPVSRRLPNNTSAPSHDCARVSTRGLRVRNPWLGLAYSTRWRLRGCMRGPLTMGQAPEYVRWFGAGCDMHSRMQRGLLSGELKA